MKIINYIEKIIILWLIGLIQFKKTNYIYNKKQVHNE